MTARLRNAAAAWGALILVVSLAGGLSGGVVGVHADEPAPDADALGEQTAGSATVPVVGKNAFSFPLATLDDDERQRFAVGNSFFRRNWVEAPSSTAARDGLGPHFIARSCGGCHDQDGRGAPPEFRRGVAEAPVGLLIRLSLPGVGPHGGVVPEPTYGDQFDNRAVGGVKPEGEVRIRAVAVKGRFADGTPYTLTQPRYELSRLAYGPLARGTLMSPRIRQDVGRFGWKANVPTLMHQTAGAFVGDIGITSSLFPDEACTPRQRDCRAAPHGAHGNAPEIDDTTLSQVVFYQSTLAPAARRDARAPEVQRGQQLFQAAQCAACHRPSYVTGAPPFPALSSAKVAGQRIWPYTDLLLHDMGPGLADGRPDGQANGRQWKTPPLWGVGLIHDVNSHRRLLHDGRADGVMEAVLWHGGEAEASRHQVLQMSAADRAALVKFVESL
jgi:CxxC motif-containing protein (DUF1111 family)